MKHLENVVRLINGTVLIKIYYIAKQIINEINYSHVREALNSKTQVRDEIPSSGIDVCIRNVKRMAREGVASLENERTKYLSIV